MSLPFYVPPEQLVKDRAEYARKGIARGRSIVAMEYADGMLLLAENPSRMLHKISEIYDRVAFAGVGLYNEFESLRVAGIRHADVKGYMYGRADVTAKGLANAFAQTLAGIFTHEVKPYQVEILVVGLGLDDEESSLFKVLYDGTLYDERRFCAIGGQADDLTAALQNDFADDMPRSDALELARGAFEGLEGGREIEGWEAAVLDRTAGRRAFRRLSPDELGS